MEIHLNCTRNAVSNLPPAVQKAEAMKEVKMFVVPKSLKRGLLIDNVIPNELVSEEMAERYLEITPPVFSLILPDFQSVINEIEQSYVIGNDYSAIATSCIAIESLLNYARIKLHKHHPKISKLYNRAATNDWLLNIDALKQWGYFDDVFASELSDIYKKVRCKYLHIGQSRNLRKNALRAITAAYRLMTIFIGFPEDLFSWKTGSPICKPVCKNEADPRFLEFYKPYWQ